MLTKLDIIEDTVAFYTEDPSRRALSESNTSDSLSYMCRYKAKNGNMCAVGRCINPDKYLPCMEEITAFTLINTYGMGIFKEEYQHIDNKNFWNNLQNFHDSPMYWDNEGLTEEGESYIKFLKNLYN